MFINCKQCNHPFQISPSEQSNRKYCSRKCWSKSKQATKNCEVCNQEIIGPSSDVKHRRFCSRACKYKWITDTPHPYGTGTLITEICPVCKKEFQRRKGIEKTYCSRTCFYSAWHRNRKYSKEERHHASHTIRAIAKKFLPDKCAICNWSKLPCDSHHIIPVREKGKNLLSNIIMLCPNHHRMADANLISRESLFSLWQEKYSNLEIPKHYK